GVESLDLADFGLDNDSERDVTREHACLRLQAWLTEKYGLRQALAPTTDFRSYYDDLPEDPLADDGEPATVAAKLGAARSEEAPWAPHLREGLEATAKILNVARQLGAADPKAEKPPIWSELRH
ncbi:MAG: YkgJ family cysteine cluster protein, partial [Deltaproteobacteria bacterium]|nr:YkgJ family cysteine cluster protein [Deltaproteobacteria bacterium]MBW2550261.1 YkgJ family cysteine cluster protein [Deltaproteobacteria bacterium]